MTTSPLNWPKSRLLRALGLSLVLPVSSSLAVDVTWQAATGDFNTGSNWDTGTVPTDADVAIISNGGTAQFTEGDRTVQAIAPGRNGTGTIHVSGGSLTTTIDSLRIGHDVDGTVNGNQGILEVSGTGMFTANGTNILVGFVDQETGEADDSEGQIILSGDGQFIHNTNWFVLGKHGHGILEISDNASYFHGTGNGHTVIGEHATGTAHITQTGGTFDTGTHQLRFGNDLGTATYDFQGGTINVGNWLMIGRQNGNGTFNMSGGTINKTGGGNFIVGDGATGEFHQTAGDIHINGEFWIGQSGAGTGSYYFDGGTISVNNWIALGRQGGEGTLEMTGGTITKTGGGNLELGTGDGALAILEQRGGTINLNGAGVDIAKNSNAEGILSLSGDAVLNGGDIDIGRDGSSDGTLTLSDNAEFTAGLLSFNENSSLAYGNLILDGGVLSVDRIDGNLFDNDMAGSSIITFNGGILRANRDEPAFIENIWQLNVEAGGLKIDSNGFEVTVLDPLIDDGGDVIKLGAGTVHLDGTTYEGDNNEIGGDIIVQEGTLTLNANSTVDGVVTVADAAGFGVSVHQADDQLQLSSLTLGTTDAETLEFELGVFPESTTAPIAVTDFAANGEIAVNVSGILTTGTRRLVEYTNRTGTGTFVIGALPVGVEAHIVDNAAENAIDLEITYAASLEWDGSVNGQWDVNTANWFDIGTEMDVAFEDGNPVVFNDNATGTTDIVLDTTVTPGTLAFANNGPADPEDEEAIDGLDYTISGTGSISGDIDLVKTGNGNVTLDTVNEYTGATLISDGSVTATSLADGGAPSSIGASPATPDNLVLSEAELRYTGEATTTDRGFTLRSGLNTLDLAGDVTFGGPVVLGPDGASLRVTGSSALTLSHPGEMTLGVGGDPAVNITSSGLTLEGGGTQTVHVAGSFWTTNETGMEPALVLNNTSLTVDSWLAIGRGHTTTGQKSTLTATNSSIQTGNLTLGYDTGLADFSSVHEMTLTDSTYSSEGGTILGESAGSTVTATLAGNSSFNVGAFFNIAQSGNTTLNLKDTASITTTGNFNVADRTGSQAVFNMEGDSQVSVGSNTFVGKASSGTVNISGGLFESLSSIEFQIGRSGPGVWNQTGGTVQASGWLAIGRFADITGELNISGGEFTQSQANRPIMVGEEGLGSLNISESGLVTSVGADGGTTGVLIGWQATGVGTVNLDGGTLLAYKVHGGPGQSTFNFNGGLLKAAETADTNFMTNIDTAAILSGGAQIDSNGNAITIAQSLSGEGGLTKLGEGTLTLTGLNTYTGTTTVDAGTLIIDGQNADATGEIVVGAEGAFGGSGTVGGNVSFAAGADFTVAINDGAHEPLAVLGTLDISDADLVVSGSLTEPAYVIASYIGLAATSDSFASVTVPAGYAVDYAYNGLNQIALVADGSGGETYEDWAADFELDPATDGAKTGDADHDGIENLLEFALGLNPISFDALPTATINGDVLELVYTRSVSASPQVNLMVQHAEELGGTWSTEGVVDTSIETVGDSETRKATVTITGETRGFLRLSVSE